MKKYGRPVVGEQPNTAATKTRGAAIRRRTQIERSTETRRKLIVAAIQLVHESGLARLTIKDVAGRAGLTSGAVQHHFESSRALLSAVAEHVYPVFHLPVDEVSNPRWSLRRRVDRFVNLFWGVYRLPEYLVYWELLFGTRGHSEMREVLVSMQKNTVKDAVDNLTRVFADIRLGKKAAFNFWTFVSTQLRGLALLSLFEDESVLSVDVAILKEAAYQLMVNTTERGGVIKRRA